MLETISVCMIAGWVGEEGTYRVRRVVVRLAFRVLNVVSIKLYYITALCHADHFCNATFFHSFPVFFKNNHSSMMASRLGHRPIRLSQSPVSMPLSLLSGVALFGPSLTTVSITSRNGRQDRSTRIEMASCWQAGACPPPSACTPGPFPCYQSLTKTVP